MQRVLYTTILLLLTGWPSAAMPRLMPAATNPLFGDERTRIVRVRTNAVIELPWEVLAASGWDLASIATVDVQVWRQGVQLPAQVTATGISFLADANDSSFSSEAAYWIGIGTAPGLRTFLPAHPKTPLTWEPDVVYQSVAPTLREDRWFAGELRTNAAPLLATMTLPSDLPGGTQIELAVTPIGMHTQHQISLVANGVAIGSASWDDASSAPRTVTLVTTTALAAGPAELSLVLTSSGADVVMLDSLTFSEVTVDRHSLTPALESPRSAPPLMGSDQLIIAHPDLIAALDPLIAAKQQRGRTTAVADVLAIYDTYSWGERDPEALRAYLRVLADHSYLPDSVLLLGAGSTRMRIAPDAIDPTLIPPYLIENDPIYGQVACETCYTRLNPGDPQQQPLPDLPIGRIPARNSVDAHVMIAKTVAALSPPPGRWRSQALLVADNDRDADGHVDPAGPFQPLLQELATGMPGIHRQTFTYAPDQARDDGLYQHAPALRTDLFNAWDAGASLIAYVGHASPWQWAWTGALEPVPYLLSRSDAVRSNGTRLPILLSMTCLSGAFANPTLSSVDEELLRQPGGGIVAALSPSGSGINTGHRQLVAGLLPALTAGHTLGQAHMAGLRALLAQPSDHELAWSYAILGDPDVQLPSTSFATFLPLVTR